MNPTTPAEAVCIELPDGTMLYGTVTAESTEIDGHVQVVTKTVRVRRYVTNEEEIS